MVDITSGRNYASLIRGLLVLRRKRTAFFVDEPKDGWCHLVTSGDITELHSFAQEIGLKREWFQDHRVPHYDLRVSKRELAIANGARAVTSRELIRALRRVRYAVRFERVGFWLHFWTPIWHAGRGPYVTVGLGAIAVYRGY